MTDINKATLNMLKIASEYFDSIVEQELLEACVISPRHIRKRMRSIILDAENALKDNNKQSEGN
jgi:hypothetical protein